MILYEYVVMWLEKEEKALALVLTSTVRLVSRWIALLSYALLRHGCLIAPSELLAELM